MDLIHYQLDLIDRHERERKYLVTDLLARAPLFVLALGLLAGVVAQDKLSLPAWVWVIIAGACAAVCALFTLRKPAGVFYFLAAGAAVCFVCGGAMRLEIYKQPVVNDIRFIVNDRMLATIEGVIVSEPVVAKGQGEDGGYLEKLFTSTSFYVDLKRAKTEDGWGQVGGRIRVRAGGEIADLLLGSEVRLYCWLDRIKGPGNPGQFDSQAYLARRNVYVAASVESSRAIEVRSAAKVNSFNGLRRTIKAKALALLLEKSQTQSEPENMLAALILGARSNIEPEMLDAFQRTGLLHILALSGGHVAVLAGIIVFMARAAGLGRIWRAVVCALFIILFAMAVPTYSPILRACIIGLFFCVSTAVLRRGNALNTLSLAAICLILYNPLEFYEPSWQLSFGCVLGMILFAPDIEAFLHTITSYKFMNEDGRRQMGFVRRGGAVVISALAAGFAAVAAAGPVLAYHFYNFTPLGAVWTVLTIPVVTVILVSGFFAIIVGVITPTAGYLLGQVSEFFAWVFGEMVKGIAYIDHTQVYTGAVSLWAVVLFCAMLVFLRFGYVPRRWVKAGVSLGCVGVIAGGVWAGKAGQGAELELVVFAVGHGQAIVAHAGDGRTYLFDCGSLSYPDVGARVVRPYLNYKGIGEVDAVFVSHGDADHVNGIKGTAGLAAKVMDAKSFKGSFKVLWPSGQEELTGNDSSTVVLLEAGGRKVLLCSDIEQFAQNRILAMYPELRADVVVMPHQGSSRTLDRGFIERLGPGYLIYSCAGREVEGAAEFSWAKSYFTASGGAIRVAVRDGNVAVGQF